MFSSTGEADVALAAAKPWIDQRDVADLERLQSRPSHPGRNATTSPTVSWPMVRGKVDPAILQRQRLAAVAEIVTAFPDVQVAVADPRSLDPDQHLRCRSAAASACHSHGAAALKSMTWKLFIWYLPFASYRCVVPCRLDRRATIAVKGARGC